MNEALKESKAHRWTTKAIRHLVLRLDDEAVRMSRRDRDGGTEWLLRLSLPRGQIGQRNGWCSRRREDCCRRLQTLKLEDASREISAADSSPARSDVAGASLVV
jgi:hypothetical protein